MHKAIVSLEEGKVKMREYSKFTKTQNTEMFCMRLDGASFAEIGRKFDCAAPVVRYTLRMAIETPNPNLTRYRALNDWCEREGIATMSELAQRLQMSYERAWINLRQSGGKINSHCAVKVCDITGLTRDDLAVEVSTAKGG